MKNKIFLSMGAILLGIASLVSCDPENPNNPNEQEVITNLTIKAVSSTDTAFASYSDPDGAGGNPPSIDTLKLSALSTYNIQLELLDETKNPIDTITHEIETEGEAHQFFYAFSGLSFTSAYNDNDSNGHPVGLHATWLTGNAGTGSVTIILRHQPDKSAAGVAGGDITNAGGETDIEVAFPVVVQ